jgi:hypothetical protein
MSDSLAIEPAQARKLIDAIEAPAVAEPNGTGHGTGSERESEHHGTDGGTDSAPLAKPKWEDYQDKTLFRRDNNRWLRQQSKDNALARALYDQERAEALQRDEAPQEVAEQPKLSERKQALIDANPHFRHHQHILNQLHQALLAHGIEDDSDQYFDQMGANLDRLGVRFNKPTTAAAHHEPAPEPQPVLEPPEPERRSIPVSAPVSRDAPSYGGRPSKPGAVHLSAEEREIAHKSITDPSVSNAQKELIYAKGKALMQQRQASGWRDERHGG